MGSLLANVAHELNNPLAVILMQAEQNSGISTGDPAKNIRQLINPW